jgi:hypothetical protein
VLKFRFKTFRKLRRLYVESQLFPAPNPQVVRPLPTCDRSLSIFVAMSLMAVSTIRNSRVERVDVLFVNSCMLYWQIRIIDFLKSVPHHDGTGGGGGGV